MNNQKPLQFDTFYHIFNRGNNQENIFYEAENYRYFLRKYQEYILPIADTYAYCLLRNHFHFLVRVKRVAEQREWLERWEKKTQTPKISETFRVSEAAEDQTSKVLKTFEVSDAWSPKNPSQVFSNFFNSYAKSINKRYKRSGSLFQYKFKRKPVTASKYFLNLIHYIHVNPQKHRFVEDFRQYPWSSYNSIISEKPTKLSRQDVLDWFSGS